MQSQNALRQFYWMAGQTWRFSLDEFGAISVRLSMPSFSIVLSPFLNFIGELNWPNLAMFIRVAFKMVTQTKRKGVATIHSGVEMDRSGWDECHQTGIWEMTIIPYSALFLWFVVEDCCCGCYMSVLTDRMSKSTLIIYWRAMRVREVAPV